MKKLVIFLVLLTSTPSFAGKGSCAHELRIEAAKHIGLATGCAVAGCTTLGLAIASGCVAGDYYAAGIYSGWDQGRYVLGAIVGGITSVVAVPLSACFGEGTGRLLRDADRLEAAHVIAKSKRFEDVNPSELEAAVSAFDRFYASLEDSFPEMKLSKDTVAETLEDIYSNGKEYGYCARFMYKSDRKPLENLFGLYREVESPDLIIADLRKPFKSAEKKRVRLEAFRKARADLNINFLPKNDLWPSHELDELARPLEDKYDDLESK